MADVHECMSRARALRRRGFVARALEQCRLLAQPSAQLDARATARGSKVYVEKQLIGEMGFIAIVGDSEGNSIGLHSWV